MINNGIFQAVLADPFAQENLVVVQPHQRRTNLPWTPIADRIRQLRCARSALGESRDPRSARVRLDFAQLVADQAERLVIALDRPECLEVRRVFRSLIRFNEGGATPCRGWPFLLIMRFLSVRSFGLQEFEQFRARHE